ncbi:MAG: hypothetical protein IT445_07075 [Phycisphaeraceae bacterium]|nr:hypothetical protein [Phycisphaeraceae bacterium]
MNESIDKLTWSVLLGRWVQFARSAAALPREGDGKKLRDSVADLIMLQAVWFALQHLPELDANQRALGLDRAGVLIEKHEQALRRRWEDSPMPESMQQLIDDARRQWSAAGGG